MSREGVEMVRRAYEVFDTDLDALLRLLDPAIESALANRISVSAGVVGRPA